MTKAIALFENQQKATAAVDVLAASELETADINVYESMPEDKGSDTIAGTPMMGWRPAPSTAAQPAGVGMVPVDPLEELSLSEEEEQYVRRNVEGGGVLIIVDVEDDEDAGRAESILEEQDGRIVKTLSD